MMNTKITELFQIQTPLIQAGMHKLGRAKLAAAVSNAGGLGVITAGSFSTKEELIREIDETRKLTDRPFALNISLGRRNDPSKYFEVAVEEKIPIVMTSGRNPKDYVNILKKHGICWVHSATSVKHGLKAQELGADAVVAVGYEAGGHPGLDKVSTFVLIPSMVDALSIPVIAAGGIADGRGMAAALALGAEGVMVGTRFILSDESVAHDNIKQLYLQAKETDTIIIEESIRKNHRVVRTQNAEKVLELEKRGADIEELLTIIGGEAYTKMMIDGDLEAGVTSCGQGVGLVHSIEPAQQIVEQFQTTSYEVTQNLLEKYQKQTPLPVENDSEPPTQFDSERMKRFWQAKRYMESVPFWNHLGCEITKIDPENSSVSLQVKDHIHLNSSNMVHGGVYATLLDNAMGLAAKAVSSTSVVTTSMNIHFLASATEGVLTANAKIISRSKSAFVTQGEVRDQDGRLLAYSTANFLAMKHMPVDPIY